MGIRGESRDTVGYDITHPTIEGSTLFANPRLNNETGRDVLSNVAPRVWFFGSA